MTEGWSGAGLVPALLGSGAAVARALAVGTGDLAAAAVAGGAVVPATTEVGSCILGRAAAEGLAPEGWDGAGLAER